MDIFLSGFLIFFIVLVIFLIFTLAKSTYLVKQAEVIIIERFGRYRTTLTSGLHFIVPFIDQPRKTIWTAAKEIPATGKTYRYTEIMERMDLREAIYDFPKQNVITRDNVTMEINALLYYQITDPKCAIYEVSNLPQAIEKLTQTTLRNIIGSLDLDETLTSRDMINEKLRIILDEATDKWGVKVNRVELQEVNPPADIRIAMEKQMKAERDRRALILEAEGKKRAQILESEGIKEADIMKAEGEASAKLTLAKAEADAIKVIQEAVPNGDPMPYLIAMNYMKILPEMTKDKNGKMILLPYESSQLLGSLSTIKEIFNKQ
jgi:regulator of protease activity HflC (stomatin/prohibitin superfamily)